MAIHNTRVPCDIHVRPGDLALMNLQISSRIAAGDAYYKEMRLIISNENTKGQVRKDHYATEQRSDVLQIAILDWITLPDVTPGPKKRKDNEESIDAQKKMMLSHLKTLGKKYFVQAPVFDESFFSAYALGADQVRPYIFRHGRGHDLMATFSTVNQVLTGVEGQEWLRPTNWDDYCAAARLAIRYFNGWIMCAEPVYNQLGTWFKPLVTNVVIDDGVWKFAEYTPHLVAPKVGETILDDAIPEEGDTPGTAAPAAAAPTVPAVPLVPVVQSAPPVLPKVVEVQIFAPDGIPDDDDDKSNKGKEDESSDDEQEKNVF